MALSHQARIDRFGAYPTIDSFVEWRERKWFSYRKGFAELIRSIKD
jgi:hypothetical protein